MCHGTGTRSNAGRSTHGMNPSSNPPGHHGDPGWVTDSWDHHHHSSNSVVNAVNQNHFQGAPGSAGPLGRQEWEWENPMLLVHNPATAAQEMEVDRKPHELLGAAPGLPSASVCSRPYAVANYSASAIPSHSFHQHAQDSHHNTLNLTGLSASSSLRSYPGPLDAYHHHPGHHSLYPGPGAGTHGTSEFSTESLRSYEQRRRYLGMFDTQHHHSGQQQHRSVLELVKREDMFSPAGVEPVHARIGLNLGGRTYFSAEDSAVRLGKRSRMNALGTHAPMCQVQGCTADLSKAKHYHRRHKVCEIHSKAPNVIAGGRTQRFCQQCSRFHQLSEFDDTKRSCRKRLADHNRRRRKPQHSAIATIAEPFKTEEQSTNILRTSLEVGEQKPMVLQTDRSGSPAVSVAAADRDISIITSNRLQVQSPPGYGAMDDKLISSKSPGNLMSRAQPMPSSEVQALVLSVVSRTPTSGQHNNNSCSSTRQSPGTQESVYQQYLHGPSLSLSSAPGMNNARTHPHSHQQQQQQQHNSPSHQNYSSIDQQQHPVPWLAPSCSNSRSTLVQTKGTPALQCFQRDVPQFQLLNHVASSGEQLGRLGLQLQGTAATTTTTVDHGHRMLALIENPAQQQQLTSSVDDIKPHLHHGPSEMQSSTGVRSSFGSSFYDSSSSIG